MGLTAFQRMRREYAMRAKAAAEIQQERANEPETSAVASPELGQTEDFGKKRYQLQQMNKQQLAEYGISIGLHVLEEWTKGQMIEEIQKHEEGLRP